MFFSGRDTRAFFRPEAHVAKALEVRCPEALNRLSAPNSASQIIDALGGARDKSFRPLYVGT
jgi:hypothetical protein